MNAQTKVKSIRLKKEAIVKTACAEELPEQQHEWQVRFLQLDKLVRNLAVVGGMVLVLVALRNSSAPEAKSVFNALQEGAGMKWDESVGKLSFVNSLFPEEIQEVWNENRSVSVCKPIQGEVVHAWTGDEPYLLIESTELAVRSAAAGEVINIAHGKDEERIIRIRHDGFDTVYGNMKECLVQEGEQVDAEEVIGTLINAEPLVFELRRDGRSVDPEMLDFTK